jgi:hypothetical protein
VIIRESLSYFFVSEKTPSTLSSISGVGTKIRVLSESQRTQLSVTVMGVSTLAGPLIAVAQRLQSVLQHLLNSIAVLILIAVAQRLQSVLQHLLNSTL